ncbi:MAG: lipoyl(octanoyl) transferase LipB [Oscillochloris sp.]|nr:lipoyl(octanoyl) transferase LipB [Oscillochloris sp.]
MTIITTTRSVRLMRLGRIAYQAAWQRQRELAAARSGGGSDCLLLLEHPPTITLGNKADPAHVLFPAEDLARRGVEVVQSDRGGDVTYHGPGQIVGYPILKLGPLGLGAVDYVRRLEAVIMHTLADFGIAADRVAGLPGVWTADGSAKICAIGVKLSAGGISTHGFALNVAPNLADFDLIVPCGISGRAVTSMTQLLGRSLDRDAVAARLIAHFAAIFAVVLETE